MWTHYHFVVFLLTYGTYSIFHASRKVYSDSKDSLLQEWVPVDCNSSYPCLHPENLWRARWMFPSTPPAELFLGLLDTLFLFSYAVGMYFTSFVADRVELRKGLSIAMWISGVLLFSFGVLTQLLHFYNKVLYAVLWVLQGVVQSIGWPALVAVLGNWFGKSGRGLIFGIWASCTSVGNIMGNAITAGVVAHGYEYAFLIVSSMMVGGGLVVFFGLVNSPVEVGLPEPKEERPTNFLKQDAASNANLNEPTDGGPAESFIDQEVEANEIPSEEVPLSFLKALLLPGVIPYSLSFACLKLVNYAFLFWLPYYLTDNFGWDDTKSSGISTWYDVGGIIGGIVCGILSDRLNSRGPVLLAMMLISPFTLWCYKSSPKSVVINSILMANIGFFINGVANILSSATAVDLAQQKDVNNGRALATVTGIIDGTGSLGAAFGQYLVAVIKTKYGWDWVFNFFIIANVAALLFLLPIFYSNIRHSSCGNYLAAKFGHANYSRFSDDGDGDGQR